MDFDKPISTSHRPEDASTDRLPEWLPSIADRFVASFIYTNETLEQAETRFHMTAVASTREPLDEAALTLCQAIDTHEEANTLYRGTWQAVLQRKQLEQSTKLLSSEQVEEVFRSYRFNRDLETAERRAMELYRDTLAYLNKGPFHIRPTISISKTDIEALVNDLANRRIARHGNAFDKAMRFRELDQQLERIIGNVSPEDDGKRSELQEIYLLRRLIHAADASHIIHIEHGMIREDLRPDYGSADIVLTIAGSVFRLQVKNLRQKAGYEGCAVQYDVLRRAKEKINGGDTLLVELERDTIAHEYEKSRKERPNSLTRLGKRAALEPLFDALPSEERAILLHALRMTEKDLAPERETVEARGAALMAARKTIGFDRKEREDALALQQKNARQAAEDARRAEEDAERARRDAIKAHEAKLAEAGRQAAIQAEMERLRAREAKIAEIEARSRKNGNGGQPKPPRKTPASNTHTAKEQNEYWQQGPIMKIAIPRHLIRLGFLEENWMASGGIEALNKAKQAFVERFAKAKKGKPPTLNDPANEAFKTLFPTETDFEGANTKTLSS